MRLLLVVNTRRFGTVTVTESDSQKLIIATWVQGGTELQLVLGVDRDSVWIYGLFACQRPNARARLYAKGSAALAKLPCGLVCITRARVG